MRVELEVLLDRRQLTVIQMRAVLDSVGKGGLPQRILRVTVASLLTHCVPWVFPGGFIYPTNFVMVSK